ncbi:Hypothetical protein NTJ_05701 [Nesidiocoris tenuis]|uniref:Uncharacterized protein n=1 Tax=Nesidiocoris tenuis TaxID=355587 RepID=A0ABN7AKX3_9HEMI|nr:Hypothetical protein NTJ_05701 [Nesidiocoris tenuis]
MRTVESDYGKPLELVKPSDSSISTCYEAGQSSKCLRRLLPSAEEARKINEDMLAAMEKYKANSTARYNLEPWDNHRIIIGEFRPISVPGPRTIGHARLYTASCPEVMRHDIVVR